MVQPLARAGAPGIAGVRRSDARRPPPPAHVGGVARCGRARAAVLARSSARLTPAATFFRARASIKRIARIAMSHFTRIHIDVSTIAALQRGDRAAAGDVYRALAGVV